MKREISKEVRDEKTGRVITPAMLSCSCGDKVPLVRFTNTCRNCSADYNSSGARLAPRECWGEETGEQWWECI